MSCPWNKGHVNKQAFMIRKCTSLYKQTRYQSSLFSNTRSSIKKVPRHQNLLQQPLKFLFYQKQNRVMKTFSELRGKWQAHLTKSFCCFTRDRWTYCISKRSFLRFCVTALSYGFLEGARRNTVALVKNVSNKQKKCKKSL